MTYALIAEDPPKGDQPQPSAFAQFFPLIAIGMLIVFMFVMPQRKQRKEQQAMQSSLKRGAKVVTAAGIVGTIAKDIKEGEEEVLIRSEDTKLKVTKASIVRVLGMEEDAKS